MVTANFQRRSADDKASAKLRERAKQLLLSKQYKRTVEVCNDALRLTPGCYKVLRLRSVAFCELGDYRAALEDAEAVVEKVPYSGDAWYQKGYSLFHLKEFCAAAHSFSQGLELNSSDRNLQQGFIDALTLLSQSSSPRPLDDMPLPTLLSLTDPCPPMTNASLQSSTRVAISLPPDSILADLLSQDDTEATQAKPTDSVAPESPRSQETSALSPESDPLSPETDALSPDHGTMSPRHDAQSTDSVAMSPEAQVGSAEPEALSASAAALSPDTAAQPSDPDLQPPSPESQSPDTEAQSGTEA